MHRDSPQIGSEGRSADRRVSRTASVPTRSRPPGAPAAFALGPEAAAMLSDASYLERVLQWLVTDHKEADDASGGHASFRSASDVVLSLLSPSRRWPSQPGHGVEFKDFELRHAQLVKGLANKYGAKWGKALLPALQKRMADSASRDAQAVAAEMTAGLVRGSSRWALSEQKELWAAIGPSLRSALRVRHPCQDRIRTRAPGSVHHRPAARVAIPFTHTR